MARSPKIQTGSGNGRRPSTPKPKPQPTVAAPEPAEPAEPAKPEPEADPDPGAPSPDVQGPHRVDGVAHMHPQDLAQYLLAAVRLESAQAQVEVAKRDQKIHAMETERRKIELATAFRMKGQDVLAGLDALQKIQAKIRTAYAVPDGAEIIVHEETGRLILPDPDEPKPTTH